MMMITRTWWLAAATVALGCFQQGDLIGQPCAVSVDCDQGQTCASGVCVLALEDPSYQPCSPEEPCSAASDTSCSDECVCTYHIESNVCPMYTNGGAAGDGGGKIFEICGEVDPDTGTMTIRAKRYDGMIVGERPYQVRVSDDPQACGPITHYFDVVDDEPAGSSIMTFEFIPTWEAGQWEKGYCVTGSMQAGDADYDPTSAEQKSWWWSDKLEVKRICLR